MGGERGRDKKIEGKIKSKRESLGFQEDIPQIPVCVRILGDPAKRKQARERYSAAHM